MTYKETIESLITKLPETLPVDIDIVVDGNAPSAASSEFLTNKAQGDWAEEVVFRAINEHSGEFCAFKYGHTGELSAGDLGFSEFYETYQKELNEIGKRPDLLVFRKQDMPTSATPTLDEISKAIAAIEVRSSAFLIGKYFEYMRNRTEEAIKKSLDLKTQILSKPYGDLLLHKSPEIHKFIVDATEATFKNFEFRLAGWRSTKELKELSRLMKELKEQISILQKRDYLSITPKLEDLALVNRWIQKHNVPHYYLQVFFDKAYMISFKEILEIASDSDNEDISFSIEEDTKNQGKTTIKVDVKMGVPILGKIDMPDHNSHKKELARGRLLFYVKFSGGLGYLDSGLFKEKINHAL